MARLGARYRASLSVNGARTGDPKRASHKYTSFDRRCRLPSVEFRQLHCRVLILRGEYPPQRRGAKLIYRNIRPAIVGNRPIEAILFGGKGESYDNCGKRSFMDWYILSSVVRCDFCGLVC